SVQQPGIYPLGLAAQRRGDESRGPFVVRARALRVCALSNDYHPAALVGLSRCVPAVDPFAPDTRTRRVAQSPRYFSRRMVRPARLGDARRGVVAALYAAERRGISRARFDSVPRSGRDRADVADQRSDAAD